VGVRLGGGVWACVNRGSAAGGGGGKGRAAGATLDDHGRRGRPTAVPAAVGPCCRGCLATVGCSRRDGTTHRAMGARRQAPAEPQPRRQRRGRRQLELVLGRRGAGRCLRCWQQWLIARQILQVEQNAEARCEVGTIMPPCSISAAASPADPTCCAHRCAVTVGRTAGRAPGRASGRGSGQAGGCRRVPCAAPTGETGRVCMHLFVPTPWFSVVIGCRSCAWSLPRPLGPQSTATPS
jgi:hypothetical protein